MKVLSKLWYWLKPHVTNYPIATCIAAAFIGFLYVTLVLMAGNRHSYGEIVLSNRDTIVRAIVSDRLKIINSAIKQLDAEKDKINEKIKSDTTKGVASNTTNLNNQNQIIDQKLKEANDLKFRSQRERELLKVHNRDSSMAYYARYITVDRNVLLDSINSTLWNDDTLYAVKIHVFAGDTGIILGKVPNTNPVTLILKQNRRNTIMGFVTDFPAVGLWIVRCIGKTGQSRCLT